MRNLKPILLFTLFFAGIFFTTSFLMADDHVDAPAVTGTSSDLNSFYAFEGETTDNLVLVATLQGLLPPGAATLNAAFDEDVLVEFNIDKDGDLTEDLIIQAIKRGDSMYFFGPVIPEFSGLQSEIMTTATRSSVKITTAADQDAIVATENGMKLFAGPREDPFFFDLTRFNSIVSGQSTGFNDPGTDTFAGTNTLAIAIELPKTMLGAGALGENPFEPLTPVYSVWVESKRKQ